MVYPPSPPTTEHSREWAVKGRNARRLRRLALDGPPRLCHPSRRGGGYILQSRPFPMNGKGRGDRAERQLSKYRR
ncbi:hypothetical protein I5Q82_13625 [Acutalibacter muris]|uniref:Uncharacterized protein n=1 Tax=Acutalibacter muris TaxID=1796620 RepID=A0AA92L646_9FIRM|nr:hypothetical protein [Acutalibacter muris]QQR29098.1 hypothetical protein I5Q82_13625 [Acutalibacter muris]